MMFVFFVQFIDIYFVRQGNIKTLNRSVGDQTRIVVRRFPTCSGLFKYSAGSEVEIVKNISNNNNNNNKMKCDLVILCR